MFTLSLPPPTPFRLQHVNTTQGDPGSEGPSLYYLRSLSSSHQWRQYGKAYRASREEQDNPCHPSVAV